MERVCELCGGYVSATSKYDLCNKRTECRSERIRRSWADKRKADEERAQRWREQQEIRARHAEQQLAVIGPYLDMLTEEFRNDFKVPSDSYDDVWEAKKTVWRTLVAVFEMTRFSGAETPAAATKIICDAAVAGGLKLREVMLTFNSARRKVYG